MALPPHLADGMVAVPLPREEQKHIARLEAMLAALRRAEHALALRLVEQLILAEHAPFLHGKIVAIGMAMSGIIVAGRYLLVAHGAHREAPLGIALIGYQVFAGLHDKWALGRNVVALYRIAKITKNRQTAKPTRHFF